MSFSLQVLIIARDATSARNKFSFKIFFYICIYVWGKILLRRFVARNGTFEENLGISRSSSKFHATERYL
jgi:hypothetical protein